MSWPVSSASCIATASFFSVSGRTFSNISAVFKSYSTFHGKLTFENFRLHIASRISCDALQIIVHISVILLVFRYTFHASLILLRYLARVSSSQTTKPSKSSDLKHVPFDSLASIKRNPEYMSPPIIPAALNQYAECTLILKALASHTL